MTTSVNISAERLDFLLKGEFEVALKMYLTAIDELERNLLEQMHPVFVTYKNIGLTYEVADILNFSRKTIELKLLSSPQVLSSVLFDAMLSQFVYDALYTRDEAARKVRAVFDEAGLLRVGLATTQFLKYFFDVKMTFNRTKEGIKRGKKKGRVYIIRLYPLGSMCIIDDVRVSGRDNASFGMLLDKLG